MARTEEDFTFKLRRGTKAEWLAANPVLSDGEPGLEVDTHRFKVGNGFSTWTTLQDYIPDYLLEASITNFINSAVAQASPLTPEEIDQIADQVMLDLEVADLVLLWQNAKA